jgi:hypothetical protein
MEMPIVEVGFNLTERKYEVVYIPKGKGAIGRVYCDIENRCEEFIANYLKASHGIVGLRTFAISDVANNSFENMVLEHNLKILGIN